MTVWVEGFLVILVLTNLWLLGSSRLLSCIAAVSVQGVLLGILPLVIRIDAPLWRLLLQAGVSLALKGIIFPLLMLRAVRSVDARREVEPLVGYSTSLLIGVLLLAVSLYTGLRLPLPAGAGAPPRLLVPAALFTALTGLFVIVGRRSAIVQAMAYLAMENGIAAFGMALAEQEPLLVEMGTLLDAFVAVFVMGITIFQINREFDHIDSRKLSSLKDTPQ
ncbi:MAG TPA: hydrogenase [Spirochaetia bacterium]|nr:hydrogenase [Spirochaetia bacterium]